jgi:lycopene beta-cyclase
MLQDLNDCVQPREAAMMRRSGQGDASRTPTDTATDYDVVFAGMGLANALAALRVGALRPDLRIAGFDPRTAIGEGRTWSFFGSDVTSAQLAWLRPLLRQEWPAYEVRFPGLHRLVRTSICTLSGPALDAALTGVCREAAVREVMPAHVLLADGARVSAGVVLDGRGAQPTEALQCGWQKFFGQEVRLAAPHGLRHPILMDACVEQVDGFRFVYVLPFGPDRLLIEDTRYSDTPVLAPATARLEIAAYAASHGWRIAELLNEEQGALPVVLDGDMDAFWSDLGPTPPMGVRAGLFHPVTGYSLPSAVALADAVAAALPIGPAGLRRMIEDRARATWQAQGFYRMLNRMLFLAGAPDERWRVFRRFFTLQRPLIERFFAGRSTALDRMRLITGKPPVPFLSALRCIPSAGTRRSPAAATRGRSAHHRPGSATSRPVLPGGVLLSQESPGDD